ncbi:MAG: enoyl-CoA hydratase [Deltaproteobacteria bacterium RBG_13_49_15]|nr:MAG: enoyl-CoA hydratase [Deltaproteobacteria bacterium RBG_13_49_15]
MTKKNINLEKSSGVARITLARPKHNVFDITMMEELNLEFEILLADDSLKCVTIFGEGPSWCAGLEVADHKPESVHQMIETFNRIFLLMNLIEVPLIAAVHGFCLGGGMEVAIACDTIVATKSAAFGQPEIKIGFFPPYAAIRLPQLVGPAKAVEICTTGKRYTAQEALQMGFVSYVVDDDQLNASVDKLVGEISVLSPLIIRLNKRAVKRHLNFRFPESMEKVSDLFLNTLMKTEDTLEGIASFEGKRKAQWKNR